MVLTAPAVSHQPGHTLVAPFGSPMYYSTVHILGTNKQALTSINRKGLRDYCLLIFEHVMTRMVRCAPYLYTQFDALYMADHGGRL